MSEVVPLGKREGQTLEFKGRDALGDLSKLGREVVAFLNSRGGTLWIGVREENGVAVSVEGLEDAATEKRRLLDSLVDSIEPPPTASDLAVAIVATDQGNEVLRTDVKPDDSQVLHHLKKGGGRFFLERIDDRIRQLSWDEIVGRIESGKRHADAVQRTRERILEERREFLATGTQALWLRILPARALDPARALKLDLRSESICSLLTDPAESDNRPTGWNPVDAYSEPVYRQGRLEQQGASIHQDGSLRLELPLNALHWKGAADELYPYALVEYPVSMFRIARALYRDRLVEADRIVCDLVLAGLAGWKLRPFSPRSIGYLVRTPATFEEDFALLDPLAFDHEELVATPDRCGIRLVQEIYEFADFPDVRDDPLPFELDRETGRLVIDG